MIVRPLLLAAGSMLDQPAEVLIETAAAAGFSGVGLRLAGEHATVYPEQLRAQAARAGIAIHDAEVYRVDATGDPRPLFEAAAAAGATAVLVVSDLADVAATTAAVADLVELGDGFGVSVGLEYMAWTTPATPASALAMAERTGCSIVVDLLHHVRVGAGPAELDALVAAGVVGWVQLCDAMGAAPVGRERLVREARHQRLLPGTGELPIAVLLARLPVGTPISVEVQSDALLGFTARERAQLLFDTSRAVVDQAPSSTG